MVYDLLMWFPEWMRGIVALMMMLSIIPITGFLVSGGSVKNMLAYSKDWLRSIAILVAVAGVIFLAIWPFLP